MRSPELPVHPQSFKRSPVLVAAYCTLAGAVVLLLLGSGVIPVVGTAGMAVLLALGEFVVQLYRRRSAALLPALSIVIGLGVAVALVGLVVMANAFISQDEGESSGNVLMFCGVALSVTTYGVRRWVARDQSRDAAA